MHSLWLVPAFALLTAAFLWPAEDAVNGGGLYLVVLWLILGIASELRILFASRRRNESASESTPFGWIDFGVLMIVLGHLVSTVIVFQVEGDRRAAVNLTMEWAGLFVAWRLFRNICRDRINASQVVSVVTSIAVGLAVYGIWQHHVFYPEQANWYRELRSQLDHALSQSDGSEALRVSEYTSRFAAQGIPVDGSQRILWENRLLSSSEPFATFSLANTLGGILATALVLLLGQMRSEWFFGRNQKATNAIIAMVSVCLVSYCLLLTKSRSAWAGAITGVAILILLRNQTSAAKSLSRWLPVGLGVLGALLAASVTFGALDKEVILESPRSLQFRLLYWNGTLQMLKDHALAGTGPGNFRQVYLQYKAAESSEEIRDPHNFLLESWTAGGIISLAGMLVVVFCVLRQLPKNLPSETQTPATRPTASRNRRTLVAGLLMGFALHLLWEWINGHSVTESPQTYLLLMTGVLLSIIRIRHGHSPVDRVASLAAAATLMINLLAAGGFEMPAVMLLLLVCVASGLEPAADKLIPIRQARPSRRLVAGGVTAIYVAACLAVVKFGLIPVAAAERSLLVSKDIMHSQRILHAALDAAKVAADADPLGVSSRQQIAELELQRLSQLELLVIQNKTTHTQEPLEADNDKDAIDQMKVAIDQALEACENLISADRRSSTGHRIRTSCLLIGARVLNDSTMLKEAIASQQLVVGMNPTSVHDWLDLAKLCQSAPANSAAPLALAAAQRALELEAINRDWGHQDQFLTPQDLGLLTNLNEQ